MKNQKGKSKKERKNIKISSHLLFRSLVLPCLLFSFVLSSLLRVMLRVMLWCVGACGVCGTND